MAKHPTDEQTSRVKGDNDMSIADAVVEIKEAAIHFPVTMDVTRLDGRSFHIEARVTEFPDGDRGYATRVYEEGRMVNTHSIFHDHDSEVGIQKGIDFVKKYDR